MLPSKKKGWRPDLQRCTHPVDANWRRNIIRSMGDRFAVVQRLYDVYLQKNRMVCARLKRVGGELLVCIAKGYCCCATNRLRRDVEVASRC